MERILIVRKARRKQRKSHPRGEVPTNTADKTLRARVKWASGGGMVKEKGAH